MISTTAELNKYCVLIHTVGVIYSIHIQNKLGNLCESECPALVSMTKQHCMSVYTVDKVQRLYFSNNEYEKASSSSANE